MTPPPGLDRELLAERSASVVRHLDRVADQLPAAPADLTPMSAATDAVVLHLWQAVQVVIDLAVATCVRLGLGSPTTYGDAFRVLATAGVLDTALARRLAGAAGFRNLIVHADADLDLLRVHAIATTGPTDLRAFLAALRDHQRRDMSATGDVPVPATTIMTGPASAAEREFDDLIEEMLAASGGPPTDDERAEAARLLGIESA